VRKPGSDRAGGSDDRRREFRRANNRMGRTRIEQKGMFDFVNENCERVITL
jgi:hypothetical protein